MGNYGSIVLDKGVRSLSQMIMQYATRKDELKFKLQELERQKMMAAAEVGLDPTASWEDIAQAKAEQRRQAINYTQTVMNQTENQIKRNQEKQQFIESIVGDITSDPKKVWENPQIVQRAIELGVDLNQLRSQTVSPVEQAAASKVISSADFESTKALATGAYPELSGLQPKSTLGSGYTSVSQQEKRAQDFMANFYSQLLGEQSPTELTSQQAWLEFAKKYPKLAKNSSLYNYASMAKAITPIQQRFKQETKDLSSAVSYELLDTLNKEGQVLIQDEATRKAKEILDSKYKNLTPFQKSEIIQETIKSGIKQGLIKPSSQVAYELSRQKYSYGDKGQTELAAGINNYQDFFKTLDKDVSDPGTKIDMDKRATIFVDKLRNNIATDNDITDELDDIDDIITSGGKKYSVTNYLKKVAKNPRQWDELLAAMAYLNADPNDIRYKTSKELGGRVNRVNEAKQLLDALQKHPDNEYARGMYYLLKSYSNFANGGYVPLDRESILDKYKKEDIKKYDVPLDLNLDLNLLH